MARPDTFILSVALILATASAASAAYEVSTAAEPVTTSAGRGSESARTVVAGLSQSDDIEEQFLLLLNEERTTIGLDPLDPYFDLEDDAVTHTAEMIEAGDIYHTSDLTVVATGWQALGENVGYGPTVDKLHVAFMNSPHHRDNVVGDYDLIGVGADRDAAGVIFVTFIFMRSAVPEPVTLTPETAGPAAGIAGALWLGHQ